MNTMRHNRLPTAAEASLKRRHKRMSIEVFLLFGLPVMSIAACAVLAFVAYADGYTEIATLPTSATHAPTGH